MVSVALRILATVTALGAVTAFALDDAKLDEIDAAASNTEARIHIVAAGGDTNEWALLQDKLTRAKNIVMAERRKRYMVGGNLSVPSFDTQLNGMITQYEESAARLQAYYDEKAGATNPPAAASGTGSAP